MLQNDYSYFATQPRFAYLPKALREIERTWVTQLERGQESGAFRADLDARLTYRLLRDVLWLPVAVAPDAAASAPTRWRTGSSGCCSTGSPAP